MGRAIMAQIDRELVSVFGESSRDDSPAFRQQAEEELASREAEVAGQERELEAATDQMRRWSDRLRRWEDELEGRDQRAELASKLAARPDMSRTKVGRNERCPCGSGLKFKQCHGMFRRNPGSA